MYRRLGSDTEQDQHQAPGALGKREKDIKGRMGSV